MKIGNLLLIALLTSVSLFTTRQLNAQSDVYIAPPAYFSEDVRIEFEDIASSKNEYKFKLTIENKSKNKYITFDVDKTGLNLPDVGKYYPNTRKKPHIIFPDKDKSIVIAITGGPEVPLGAFDISLEGLTIGELPSESLPIPAITVTSEGTADGQEYETVDIDLKKASFKKGKYTVIFESELDQTQNYVNELLIFDGLKVTATAGGAPLEIEPSVTTGRTVEVFPAASAPFKFDAKTEETQIQVDFSKALHKISMEKMTIPAFAISNGRTQHSVKTCPSFNAPTDGAIKINVSSDVGCFKFYMIGEEYTPDYTSSLTYNVNASSKKVKIIMEDGAIIEKSIYAKDDYKALYYTIKQKNGEYSLKYLPLSSEEADKSSRNDSQPSNNNGGTQTTDRTPRSCPTQNAGMSGSVAIQLYSQVGCFNVYMQGRMMTSDLTSNFTFNTSESVAKKVKVIMEDGGVIEKTIFVGEGYDRLFYEVKLNKGKYSLKSKPFAAEQSEETQNNNQGSNDSRNNGQQDFSQCSMGSSAFGRLKNTIEGESMDNDKLRVAKHAAQNSCLSVYQIKEITQLFSFSAQQLEFAKVAYGNCRNRAEYYEVIGVFKFEKDKNELEQYIQNY